MQKKYILDSNIVIHLLRGNEKVRRHIEEVGIENCYISEVTTFELYYGAECSAHPEENRELVAALVAEFTVIPFRVSLREACRQKAALRKSGTMIEDWDILIGSTGVVLDYIVVTENTKHLSHLYDIRLENWNA